MVVETKIQEVLKLNKNRTMFSEEVLNKMKESAINIEDLPEDDDYIQDDVWEEIYKEKNKMKELMQEARRVIRISTNSKEEEFKVMENIHKQLVGNQDYIDNRIVLNDSSTRNDGTENEVHLYIFNDCITRPDIKIFI